MLKHKDPGTVMRYDHGQKSCPSKLTHYLNFMLVPANAGDCRG